MYSFSLTLSVRNMRRTGFFSDVCDFYFPPPIARTDIATRKSHIQLHFSRPVNVVQNQDRVENAKSHTL